MRSTLFFSFVGSLIICMAPIPAVDGDGQPTPIPGYSHGPTPCALDPVAKVGGIAFGIGTAMLIWAPKDDIVVAGLPGGVTTCRSACGMTGARVYGQIHGTGGGGGH
ncbi:MAG: hypothetical protein U0361_02865 [Nitrospiraceae bacterium]